MSRNIICGAQNVKIRYQQNYKTGGKDEKFCFFVTFVYQPWDFCFHSKTRKPPKNLPNKLNNNIILMKMFHVLLKWIRRLLTEGYDARLNLLLIKMLLTLLVSRFDLIGSDPSQPQHNGLELLWKRSNQVWKTRFRSFHRNDFQKSTSSHWHGFLRWKKEAGNMQQKQNPPHHHCFVEAPEILDTDRQPKF